MDCSACPSGKEFRVKDSRLSLYVLIKLGKRIMISKINPELHKEAQKVLSCQIGEWVRVPAEAEIELEN